MNIDLTTNQYLSAESHQLPTKAGLYLINASTGVGKSVHMTNQSDLNNDVVVFPQKSILAQQQAKAEKSGKRLNVLQLEKFNKKALSDFVGYECKAIHVDEIQLLYEADYRAQAVSELKEQVTSLAKHYPVFCYSGTYLLELSPLDFDEIYNINKPSEPIEFDVVFTTPKKQEQGYNGITNECLRETIYDCFHEYSRPVLFFNNDHKQNVDLAEHLSQKGLRTLCINRDAVRDKENKFHELAKHEQISDMQVDVVLSTSALEEGINVHDELTVISVQTAPERIVQQWGRARNRDKAKFILVCGYGDSHISEKKALETVKALDHQDFDAARSRSAHGIDEKAMLIPDSKHRLAVMARASQVTKLQRPAYAMQVIDGLKKYGFQMSDNIMQFDKSMTLSATRVKRSDVVEAIELNLSVEEFANKHQMHIAHAHCAIKKAHDFESRFYETAMNGAVDYLTQKAVETGQVDLVKDYWLSAYNSITESAITWLSNLSSEQLAQCRTAIQALYGNENVRRRNKAQMAELADSFWGYLYSSDGDIKPEWLCSQSWLEPEYDRARLKLFRFMMGYEYDAGHAVYILNKLDWWKAELTNAQRNKYNVRKKYIEKVTSIEQFHEETRLDRVQVSNLKTKDVKQLVNEIDWGD